MNWKFWKRPRWFDFGSHKRRYVVLRDLISAIVVGISTAIAALVPASIGWTAYAIATVLTYGILLGASYAASALLGGLGGGKKPSSENFKQGKELQNTMEIGATVWPAYGKRRIGGNRLFAWTTTGSNLKYLHMIIGWGEGPMKGPVVDGAGEKIWLDDQRMQYFQTYKGLNLVFHEFHKGTHDQVVSAELQSYIPTWNEAMRYTAYSYFRFKYHATAWGSLPRVTCEMEGDENVFDDRDGSHGYSRNGVLATRDFVTHPRYGGGVQGSLLNAASVIDAANWVEDVSHQYYFDGVIQERQPFADNVSDMMANFKGDVVWSGGQYKFLIHQYSAPVCDVDELLIEENPGGNALGIDTGSSEDTPRRIKGYFADPTDNYNPKPVYWPQVAADVAESDKIAMELSLIGTCDYGQALRLIKFNYMRAWYSKSFSCIAHPSLYGKELGDIFTISHNADVPGSSIPVGWSLKPVRIQKIGMSQTNKIALQLLDEHASIYNEDVGTVAHAAYSLILPGFDDTPDAMPTNLTAATSEDESTVKLVDAYLAFTMNRVVGAEGYEVRYRKPTDAKWRKEKAHDPGGEIGLPVFTGTGTIKIEAGGDCFDDTLKTYTVEIDGVGSPNTIRWKSQGIMWEGSLVPLTGDWQDIGTSGVRIRSSALTGGVIGDKWEFTADSPATVTLVSGKLPCNQLYYWQACAIIDGKRSEWATPAVPITTWMPAAPAITGVTLTVTAKKGFNLVKWTKPTAGDKFIDKWLLYRNTVNSIPADDDPGIIELDAKKKKYEDHEVESGKTYFYWLKFRDKAEQLSTSYAGPQSTDPIENPITPGNACFLAHFDGNPPDALDTTGNLVDSLGQAPTVVSGGVIFRPGKFGKGVQIARRTTNHITNPSFEVNTAGWVALYGATLARITTDAYVGVACLKVTTTGANTDGVTFALVTSWGGSWSFSGRVKAFSSADVGKTVDLYIRISYTDLTTDDYSYRYTLTSEWQYFTKTVLANAGKTVSMVQYMVRDLMFVTQGAFSFLLDATQLENLPYSTCYCDGSLGLAPGESTDLCDNGTYVRGHCFTGTAHASTSVRQTCSLRYSDASIDNRQGTVILRFIPYGENIGNGNVLFNCNPSAQWFAYYGFTTKKIEFAVAGVYGNYTMPDSIIGTHVMLAITWDHANNVAKMYINDVLRSTIAPGTTPWTKSGYIEIGGWNPLNANAVEDDFYLDKRVLSADVIAAVYASNAPINEIVSVLEDTLPPYPYNGAQGDLPTGMTTDVNPTAQAAGSDKYKIGVSWNRGVDNSGSKVKYELCWRKNGETDWETRDVGDVPVTQTTVTEWIKGLELGDTLIWKVRYYDKQKNYSAYCADQSKAITATLSAPTIVGSATNDDESTLNKVDAYIELSWTAVAGLDYELKWKKTGTTNWHTVRVKDPGAGSYTERINQLQCGIGITWKVKAIKGAAIQSAWTSDQTLTTWTPTLSAPTTLTRATDEDKDTNNSTMAYVLVTWDLVAGLDYEIQWWYTDGVASTLAVKDIGSGLTAMEKIRNLECDQLFDWRVRATKGGTIFSAWAEGASITTWKPATPTAPSNITLEVKSDAFQIAFDKVSETNLVGYEILASPNGSNFEVIKKVAKSVNANKISVKPGDASTSYIITYNANWYFAVRSVNKWGVASSATASSPTYAYIPKANWLRDFLKPWKFTQAAVVRRTIAYPTLSDDYTIPANKVGLIQTWHLKGVSAAASIYAINVLYQIDVTTAGDPSAWERFAGADKSNGLYFPTGDHIYLSIPNVAGAEATCHIKTFDPDSDFEVISEIVSSAPATYTVPAGKKLVVTSIVDYTGGWLTVNTYNFWYSNGARLTIGDGGMMFPSGAVIGGVGHLILGVLVKE